MRHTTDDEVPMPQPEIALPIPLYHGTSTLFFNDIVELGLGGKDPLAELNLIEFARAIHPLVEQHLADTRLYASRSGSFNRMVNQASGRTNYQHGQTYVSPARDTAIRYAVNKRLGSELLTYTVDFLQLLAEREVPMVRDDLYQRYRSVYRFLDVSPAPILIQANAVPFETLAAEDGGDIESSLRRISEVLYQFPDRYESMLQQTNFRLTTPVHLSQLEFWFINVLSYDSLMPKYTLHRIDPCPGA